MFYLIDTVAAACSLLAIRIWTMQQFSYPLYLMIINFAMVLLILRPKKQRVHALSSL